MYIYHIFLIQLSVDGHLLCFHVLAMVNSAAVNVRVHVSLLSRVLSGHIPKSGVAGSYGSSMYSFLRYLHTIFCSDCTSSAGGFLFSTSPPALAICGFINDGHSAWCEVVSHGGFDLHFSYNQRCGAFFHVLAGHLYLAWRTVYSGLLPIFPLIECLFCC